MGKQKINPKKRLVIYVNKEPWIVELYSRQKYQKYLGNSFGTTAYDHKAGKRYIMLRCPVSLNTIAHELMHAYCSYINFSRMKIQRIEEEICQLIGKKHNILNRLAFTIHKRLYKK